MLKFAPNEISKKYLKKDLTLLQYRLEDLLEFQSNQMTRLLNFWDLNYLSLERLPITDRNSKRNLIMEDSFCLQTSGTTNVPLKYCVWEPSFNKIETEWHYQQILKEYNLENPKILRVTPFNESLLKYCEIIIWKGFKFWKRHFLPKKNDYRWSHGSENSICYHYMYKPSELVPFCEFLLESNLKIDVFLTSFSFLNLLYNCHKQSNKKNQKFCTLISSTCENSSQKIMEEITNNNGFVDFFCDHMRCWDGGFTFFTCRYKQYHTFDYLCFAEEYDGKLISTDIFNFSMPFIRYWNGDCINFLSDWQKCKCGRYFKKFKFEGNRNFFVCGENKKITSIEIYDSISILSNAQALCYKDKIEITTLEELDEETKNLIRNKVPLSIEFTTKNYKMSGRFNKILRVKDCSNES